MTHSQEIFIRKVEKTEVKELQEIARGTFIEAFGPVNTPADIEKYVTQSFSFENIKSELNHPESQFYFAESAGEIIGYLKLNQGEAQTDTAIDNALEIERIYVTSKFYGKSVGQLLLNKAIEIAKADNFEWVWLGVWEKNPRAIRFYEKSGFTTFSTHSFLLGDDQQTDLLMKLEL